MKEQKVFADYLAEIGAWVLGVAMFVYLGYRTLDFLTFTFREEDAFFAYLGLFSTTVGAVIFAIIYSRSFYYDRTSKVWRSDEFKKTVALVMTLICFAGEVALAVADMTIITAQKGGAVAMTEGELKTIMWLTAGLAGLVGAAVAVIKLTPRHPKTDPVMDMSDKDTDNNGVLDNRERGGKPVNVNALETKIAQLESQLRKSEDSASNSAKKPVKNESGAEKGDNGQAGGNDAKKA